MGRRSSYRGFNVALLVLNRPSNDSAPAIPPSPPFSQTSQRTTSTPSAAPTARTASTSSSRSEEHTSELQSQSNLVCRLLLEKKKTQPNLSHQRTRDDEREV